MLPVFLLLLPLVNIFAAGQRLPSPCLLGGVYKACDCRKLTINSGDVTCTKQKWHGLMPSLPHGYFKVRQLEVEHSGISTVGPHSFEGHEVAIIDLSRNSISHVDSKAFAGLEVCCHLLITVAL